MVKRLTTEEFVERAVAVHGDTYDYTKTVYVGALDKVEIGCKNGHGNFWQSASSHVTVKRGCAECSPKARSTKEAFVVKAKAIHGNRYSYDRVTYLDNKTKVEVTCNRGHGSFFVTPGGHLHNQTGCPSCSSARLLTTKEYVEKAEVVFGSKYSYALVEYIDSKTKIEVICDSGHRNFWVLPSAHLSKGSGCPACGGCEVPTNESFIEQSNKMHGGIYTYEKTVYKDAKSKVIVTCKVHGDFQVIANTHKNGAKCFSCSGSAKGTTESFIARSLTVKKHKNRYSYEKSVYDGVLTKVIVTCKDHGDFTTLPSDHYRGQGCPSCSSTGYKDTLPGTFYVLSDGYFTKVGITNNDADSRASYIASKTGYSFTKLYSVTLDNGEAIRLFEKSMLKLLRGMHERPKTKFHGSTECFIGVDTPELLTLISQQISILKDTQPS